MSKKKEKHLVEVWGDTVALDELGYASLLGAILTIAFYLLGRVFLGKIGTIDPSLVKGYSLMVGIVGCLLSGFISSKLFKPKRIIEDRIKLEEIETVLANNGITLEEEIEALSKLPADVIKEMEDVGLWQLLALIPESSPNYNPEYKLRAEKQKGGEV